MGCMKKNRWEAPEEVPECRVDLPEVNAAPDISGQGSAKIGGGYRS